MEDVHVRTDTHSCRGIILDDEASIITANQTSLLVFSSNTITRFLLIYFFASLFLLVIDIISDVISMSGSRLIVCVCVL